MKAASWELDVVSIAAGVLDGPLWDGAGLLLCDATGNRILRFDPSTSVTTVEREFTVGTTGLAIDPSGNMYGAQSAARRVVWYEPSGGAYRLETTLDGRRHNHPRHLLADRDGHLWFTDRYADRKGGPAKVPMLDHSSVLRLTPRDGPVAGERVAWRLDRMTFDTVEPHGIALIDGGRTLLVTDSGPTPDDPHVLRAYPITGDGALGAGRVVHRFNTDERAGGIAEGPDGWIVVAAGPTIVALDPDGDPIAPQPVPTGSATACAFGGSDLDVLFVTTDRGAVLRHAWGRSR